MLETFLLGLPAVASISLIALLFVPGIQTPIIKEAIAESKIIDLGSLIISLSALALVSISYLIPLFEDRNDKYPYAYVNCQENITSVECEKIDLLEQIEKNQEKNNDFLQEIEFELERIGRKLSY